MDARAVAVGQCGFAVTAADPSGHFDLEVGRAGKAEQRDLRYALLAIPRQARVHERQNVGAERIADQRYPPGMPSGCVGFDDRRQIACRLLRRLIAPEVTQAVPADDRDARALHVFCNHFVEVAPAAVAGQNDCQQRRRLAGRQLEQR